MDSFKRLSQLSHDIHQKMNPNSHINIGREILVHAEFHLFHQVSGDHSEFPLIEGGYHGINYSNALQCLANLITSIEVEENLKAIKDGRRSPYGISFKH